MDKLRIATSVVEGLMVIAVVVEGKVFKWRNT
jgi:hypothetical protein